MKLCIHGDNIPVEGSVSRIFFIFAFYMSIYPCICIYVISLNRPETQLICGILYVYNTLGGV